MSSIQLTTISGSANNAVQYSGKWLLNTNVTGSSGDRTFTPAQFTLDSTHKNVNAAALLSANTTYFAIQFPVQGEYVVTFGHRGSLPIAANTNYDVWSYIGAHVYNGTNYAALGTPPSLGRRHSNLQNTWTNATANSQTWVVHHTPCITKEYNKNDVVAPWIGSNSSSYSAVGSSSEPVTFFEVTLLKQTM